MHGGLLEIKRLAGNVTLHIHREFLADLLRHSAEERAEVFCRRRFLAQIPYGFPSLIDGRSQLRPRAVQQILLRFWLCRTEAGMRFHEG